MDSETERIYDEGVRCEAEGLLEEAEARYLAAAKVGHAGALSSLIDLLDKTDRASAAETLRNAAREQHR